MGNKRINLLDISFFIMKEDVESHKISQDILMNLRKLHKYLKITFFPMYFQKNYY